MLTTWNGKRVLKREKSWFIAKSTNKMVEINKEVKKLIEENPLAFATVDDTGKPNVKKSRIIPSLKAEALTFGILDSKVALKHFIVSEIKDF